MTFTKLQEMRMLEEHLLEMRDRAQSDRAEADREVEYARAAGECGAFSEVLGWVQSAITRIESEEATPC